MPCQFDTTTKILKIMTTYFNFEIYTSDPSTGTTGWDIFMVSVKADTYEEAIINLKKFPNFDCVILFNFVREEEEETADFLVTENWPTFKIIDRK